MAEQKSLFPDILNINEGSEDEGHPERVYTPSDKQFQSVEDYANYFTSPINKTSNTILKALGWESVPTQLQAFSHISYMPGHQVGVSGVLQWPGLPPQTLQKLAKEHTGPQIIIGVRQDEVLKYGDLSEHPWKPGWQIIPRDVDDTLTSTTKKQIKDVEFFLMNGGMDEAFSDPRVRDSRYRVGFITFLAEIVRNSLTYDGIAIWTQTDKKGNVISFLPFPAQNIRLLARHDTTSKTSGSGALKIRQAPLDFSGSATSTRGPKINDEHFAVAVDDTGNLVGEPFTRRDLIWYVRNPRADVDVGGYGFSELEAALLLVTGFTNALQFNCYSEDTEVLTKIGWKTFKNVKINSDEFATLNTENGQLEYQKAKVDSKIWQPYVGTMYHIHARSFDLLVTPNHRILLQHKYNSTVLKDGQARVNNSDYGKEPDVESYRTVTAEFLCNELNDFQQSTGKDKQDINHRTKYSGYWQIPVTAGWCGTEIGKRIFTNEHGVAVHMTGDQYCAFIGMFLGAGSIDKRNIYIDYCKKSKGYKPVKDLLHDIFGTTSVYSGHQFIIYNKDLLKHLMQLVSSCSSKFIPYEILNATPKQIQIFLDYFLSHDRNIQKINYGKFKTLGMGKSDGKKNHIITTSKRIVDQLQELAVKLGYSASIATKLAFKASEPVLIKKAVGDWEYVNNSHKTGQAIEFYEVCLKSIPTHSLTIEQVQYSGYIGCITVPNGTVIVRRNNKVCISRNSDLFDKNSIPKGILAIKGNYTPKQFDAFARIWDNLQRGPRTDWTLPAVQLSEQGAIELINLEPLRKEPAYYNQLINLFMGALSAVYRFPPHKLGYKVSGTERDTKRDLPQNLIDTDDVGLSVLLTHIENLINTYLLSAWPHLKFRFTAKSPREDARWYEARMLSMSLGEKRKMVGLKPLTETATSTLTKELAEIMEMSPTDPSLIGVYQSAISHLIGVGSGNKNPGARFNSKKDPAISEQHGHMSGVRRDSRSEEIAKPNNSSSEK